MTSVPVSGSMAQGVGSGTFLGPPHSVLRCMFLFSVRSTSGFEVEIHAALAPIQHAPKPLHSGLQPREVHVELAVGVQDPRYHARGYPARMDPPRVTQAAGFARYQIGRGRSLALPRSHVEGLRCPAQCAARILSNDTPHIARPCSLRLRRREATHGCAPFFIMGCEYTGTMGATSGYRSLAARARRREGCADGGRGRSVAGNHGVGLHAMNERMRMVRRFGSLCKWRTMWWRESQEKPGQCIGPHVARHPAPRGHPRSAFAPKYAVVQVLTAASAVQCLRLRRFVLRQQDLRIASTESAQTYGLPIPLAVTGDTEQIACLPQPKPLAQCLGTSCARRCRLRACEWRHPLRCSSRACTDRALIERLVRLAQVHDLLKKTASARRSFSRRTRRCGCSRNTNNMNLAGEDVGAAGGGGEAAWSGGDGGDGAGGEEGGGDECSGADGRTASALAHHATYGHVPAHLSGLARVRAEQSESGMPEGDPRGRTYAQEERHTRVRTPSPKAAKPKTPYTITKGEKRGMLAQSGQATLEKSIYGEGASATRPLALSARESHCQDRQQCDSTHSRGVSATRFKLSMVTVTSGTHDEVMRTAVPFTCRSI
ncbi:hypothetical protein B0H14DRAFT_3639992 [Mycena olivaceomarginata]|nr:hypothetical protein B0H14DRAFT_3639992 [Mycena olivaceomarginata]